MKYFLGIDGGGTKTKFILCDEKGILHASSIQPTCHYLQCGLDGVSVVFRNGLQECLAIAKVSKEDIRYTFAACAGYGDIEEDNSKIEKAVAIALAPIPCTVGNDTENALAGSLAGQPGINLIAGTGSIGMGIDDRGVSFRSGGWHHAFGGDEGSAFWLASNLLRLFTRQSDNRDKKTILYSYMKEKMNWINDDDMLKECVVKWNFDRTKIASLAKHVYVLAELNDPHAIHLYQRAAEELGDIAKAIYHTLNMKNKTLLSYSGGVFNSKDYIVEPLKEYLKDISIDIIDPILTPDKGGVLLAMKLAGHSINDEIIENLKKD
jgi:N-acetylglucosamine kinase-like BadF-type ATPase